MKHKNGDEMDCSNLEYAPVPREGYGDEGWEEELAIDAVDRDQCSRCGGYGQFARDCPTPKGKGKDSKGKGKGFKGKGNWSPPGKGGGGALSQQQRLCHYCHQPGHIKANCWAFAKGQGKGKSQDSKLNGLEEEWSTEQEDTVVPLSHLQLNALDVDEDSSHLPSRGKEGSDSGSVRGSLASPVTTTAPILIPLVSRTPCGVQIEYLRYRGLRKTR